MKKYIKSYVQKKNFKKMFKIIILISIFSIINGQQKVEENFYPFGTSNNDQVAPKTYLNNATFGLIRFNDTKDFQFFN